MSTSNAPMWTCASISPGSRLRPRQSTDRSTLDRTVPPSTTSAIRSPETTTAPGNGSWPVPVMTAALVNATDPADWSTARETTDRACGLPAGQAFDDRCEVVDLVEQERADPEPLPQLHELPREPVDRPDEDVRRVQHLLGGDLDAGQRTQPVGPVLGLGTGVVGDDDRASAGVGVELEPAEPVAGRSPDPADLLLRGGGGQAARVHAQRALCVPCGQHRPRRQPDGVRLLGGQRQRAPPTAADEQGWVWPLHRLGLAVMAGDGVVLAGEGERPVGEAALQNRYRLAEPGDPGRDPVERQADRVVLRTVPAGADPVLGATAGQHVQGGELVGENGRVAQVDVAHER